MEPNLTITAAVYTRKSTADDRGAADQSVARQREEAQRFATERGWKVPEDLVFTDNEISAADWKGRTAWRARARASGPLA